MRKLRSKLRMIYNFFLKFVCPMCYETINSTVPITLKGLFFQKILGFNRNVYWPTHFTSVINDYRNIEIGIGSAPGAAPGCYIQGIGKIKIGDYTTIATNVGIISANHDIYDLKKHVKTNVIIGNYCWIGINSTILPGVNLGDFAIVGAGSVVTKSFEEGYCIIAGNPAKIIKHLDKDKCIHFENEHKYHGYIKSEKFEAFKQKKLNSEVY